MSGGGARRATAAPATRRRAAASLALADLQQVDVEDQRFSVMLIPHTLTVTTLGKLEPGDTVNLETDVLAKYVERQLAAPPANNS